MCGLHVAVGGEEDKSALAAEGNDVIIFYSLLTFARFGIREVVIKYLNRESGGF